MVAGAFPIVKLAALAMKQLSRPIANRIKNRAKNSHFFRTYICMPPAQLYHWTEVNVKMRLLNLGKPTEVAKLNENMAIELGAELLGEGIIFVIAAATLTTEYIRSSLKEKDKVQAEEERFRNLESTVQELRFTVMTQDAEIRHLERTCISLPSLLTKKMKDDTSEDRKNDNHKKKEGFVEKAIQDASNVITGKKVN